VLIQPITEMALLEVARASKRFGTTAAVDDVSLTIERGALFALLGPSGCGKTTLLRMIAGFETPDNGRILLDGVDVTALPPYARPVNMMFQSYALFPHMTVAGNIAFGLRQDRMDRRHIAARVEEMLALVQMSGYARRRPHELSGGQRQRVALARALAKLPKLLLLDEPLAALDRKLRAETRLELIGIQERVGTTFLFVTHDQEEALSMASLVAVMDRGRLVQIGAPAEIYEQPCSRFVADFVGEANLFEGELILSFSCPALAVAGLGEPIPLPSGTNLPDGAAAAVVVRPENLMLAHSRPAGFAIAATVSSTGYLGGGSIVHLMAGHGRLLKARLPSSAAARFGRGMAVWASWCPEAGVVLTQ
jgi:putrescine transport system ATP-binding protein